MQLQAFKNKTLWLILAPLLTGAAILAFLGIWFLRSGPGGVIRITSEGGTLSPVNRENLQKGLDLAKCGDEIQIEAGAFVRTGAEVASIVFNGSTMTVTTSYSHDFVVGDKLKLTGLDGTVASLNDNQFPVTEVPSLNTLTLTAVSPILNVPYTNPGMTLFADKFLIRYDSSKKNCREGNEITITTTKKDWLPDADMRITPSYRPLIPTLQLVGDSANRALLGVEDKVAGLKFVGVGFQKIGVVPYTLYSFLEIGLSEPMAGEGDLPQRISFDRSLFYNDHQLGSSWKNTINMKVKGFSFLNNFVDDMMPRPSDEETYIANVGLSFGPFTIRNNYTCCAIGIPFIFGARAADFTTGNPIISGIMLEHNHFYTSPKHYPTSPTYVGDANRSIVKNCSELKTGLNAIFRWNTCENQFSGGGSQWYGFTFSARSFTFPGEGTCSLDAAKTVLTCPQLKFANPMAGHVIGVDTGSKVLGAKYQWRTLVSADKSGHRFMMSEPYGSEVAETNLNIMYSANPWQKVDKVQVYGNYFKNVAGAIQIMGEDTPYPVRTENIIMKNNLMVYDSPYFKADPKLNFYKAPFYICCRGKNYQFENNTVYENPNWKPGIEYARLFRLEADAGQPIENVSFRNNLFPFSYMGGGLGQVKTMVAADLLKNVSFRNNTMVGSGSAIQPCAPEDCRGNFIDGTYAPQFRNAQKNDFSLMPGSPYSNAGTDGKDLGVNMEEVAVIRELSVTAEAHSLLFSWRVPVVMKTMGCQLEVSPNSNLTTDLGSYQVVNALRPDYFIRADSDRSNKRASQSEDRLVRKFQVGQNKQEADDNGQMRNLALNPGTDYYYRLMCGGATERGSVRTTK